MLDAEGLVITERNRGRELAHPTAAGWRPAEAGSLTSHGVTVRGFPPRRAAAGWLMPSPSAGPMR